MQVICAAQLNPCRVVTLPRLFPETVTEVASTPLRIGGAIAMVAQNSLKWVLQTVPRRINVTLTRTVLLKAFDFARCVPAVHGNAAHQGRRDRSIVENSYYLGG
jgi:hypothetical protein